MTKLLLLRLIHEFITPTLFFFCTHFYLTSVLNPSHPCSPFSRQQFPSPKFLSAVTSLCLSRACGITTETARKLAALSDCSLPTVPGLCSRCALLLTRTHATHVLLSLHHCSACNTYLAQR